MNSYRGYYSKYDLVAAIIIYIVVLILIIPMCFFYSCSPTSCSSLPLPPDGVPLHQYMWPRNPCCDVSSIVTQATSSSPQNSSSQNYLRLLPKSKENSAAGVTAAALSHSKWKSPKKRRILVEIYLDFGKHTLFPN